MKGIEYKGVKPSFGKEQEPTPKTTPELELIERDFAKAERNAEIWGDSLRLLMEDLAEIEAKEGPLDPEDPRLTAIKIAAMRTDEAKTMLRDLKEERYEAASRAGMN
ncbi:hypothetical protein EDM68_05505 [Candidatus Uhrbacteria bacterium]|nr:MAG: hypothetical protein EDM68_05505 [Candidatus Uhrbacteria bacterium]